MNARPGPASRRDRLVGRLGMLSLGIPIAAGLAVVGVGALAAASYPGKSTSSATTAGGTGQNSGSAVGGSTTSVVGGAVAPVAGRGSADVSSGSS